MVTQEKFAVPTGITGHWLIAGMIFVRDQWKLVLGIDFEVYACFSLPMYDMVTKPYQT